MIEKFTVMEWLATRKGMTTKEFREKAGQGKCVVCEKDVSPYDNLCTAHKIAYHRWRNQERTKRYLKAIEISEILKISKETLLKKVVEVLGKAESRLEGLEIARRILVEDYGENWWQSKDSHHIQYRLGCRINQLLGMKDFGIANRRRLGIRYDVSDSENHPLRFYLSPKVAE